MWLVCRSEGVGCGGGEREETIHYGGVFVISDGPIRCERADAPPERLW